MFDVAIQAAIGRPRDRAHAPSRPHARDVTAKCYGGDPPRASKKKLLEKQQRARSG